MPWHSRRPPGASRIDVPVLGRKPLGWRTLRALRRRAKGVDVVIAYGSTTLPACAISMFGLVDAVRLPEHRGSDGLGPQRLASSTHRLLDAAGAEDRCALARRGRLDL